MSKTTITAKIRSDGTVVEVLEEGGERPFPDMPMRAMTDEEIETAARADPDAQPLTEADSRRMKRTPRTKIIRRALGLTQEEFAARFHIPLVDLRDWEQGRVEPDPLARAYLAVIAHDSESVRRALQS